MAIDAQRFKAAPLEASEKQPARSFGCISVTCNRGMRDTITLLFVTPSLSEGSIQGTTKSACVVKGAFAALRQVF